MENWERDRKEVNLARVEIRLFKATDHFLGMFHYYWLFCSVSTQRRETEAEGPPEIGTWHPRPRKWCSLRWVPLHHP